MKKTVFLFVTFLLTVIIPLHLFAIEWPQEEHNDGSILSYFAQNVGNNISTSIIFTDPSEVKAIKDGTILIVMSDIEDDSEFFPSALGSSIILAHDDDIISVYGNFDRDSLKQNTAGKTSVKEGEIMGETGNSGWQEKRSNLEFQIIDTQKSTAINPKLLLPRVDNEKDYNLSGILIQNKDGVFYDLKENRTFSSGMYKVYHLRNKISVPYKITATINGVIVDEISLDTIGEADGRLYVTGKERYYSKDLYPDQQLILSGEMMLTPGKSTLGLTVVNFLGKTKQITYNLSIY